MMSFPYNSLSILDISVIQKNNNLGYFPGLKVQQQSIWGKLSKCTKFSNLDREQTTFSKLYDSYQVDLFRDLCH